MPESEVVINVEPPLPDIVVQVGDLTPAVEVSVEPPPPPIVAQVTDQELPDVVVEPPLPPIEVHVSDVALPGRDGRDGRDGIDGKDGGDIGGLMYDHVNSQTPHPVYDDGPSLLLLYQNAKV